MDTTFSDSCAVLYHSTMDNAELIYELVQHSILIKVENGDHTFGAKHPFNPETDVTPMLEELVENTVEFFID